MFDLILVIITALCSGLIATVVTIWWQKKNQLKIERTKVFSVLMSHRYDISSEESVRALNTIDVLFYSSERIRNAWKAFKDATNLPDSPTRPQSIVDKHLRLLEIMAEELGYDKIKWDDIKDYYYPIGLSNRKRDEEVLRKVQIDSGIAQLSNIQKDEKAGQTTKNDEMMNQILIEGIKNPDSLMKLLEFAEKAQTLQTGKE